MTDRRWQDIWMEQCEAAEAILHRYGVEPAFDYIVGEKLVNFVEAAAENPAFAQALPRFVSRVCCRYRLNSQSVGAVWPSSPQGTHWAMADRRVR